MRFNLAAAFLLCAAGAANADPRDTLSFTNVNSDGDEGAASNAVVSRTVASNYVVSRLRINGTLNSVSPFTYASEALIKVSPPNGSQPFYLQLSGVNDNYATLNFNNVDIYLHSPVFGSAGAWDFRFFEGYDDGGVDGNWANLAITLDDRPPGFGESGDAGSLPGTAASPIGSGTLYGLIGTVENDEDMYRIQICDPANFSATTVGGSAVDTRLFLFNAAGRGVVYNDDYAPSPEEYHLQSRIHNLGNITPGTYYIAVAAYQRMAIDSANQDLWAATPYDDVRAPDGPGAANTLNGWSGESLDAGNYVIALTGACYPPPDCGSGDYNGDGDFGTDQDIEAFFACLAGTCCPTCWHGGSDFNGDGDYGTDADIESLFRVLSGGNC